MKIEDVDDEGVMMLRDAIVLQAIRDLKNSYKKRYMNESNKLERWFRGEQFNVLTFGEIDPDEVIHHAYGNGDIYKRHYSHKYERM